MATIKEIKSFEVSTNLELAYEYVNHKTLEEAEEAQHIILIAEGIASTVDDNKYIWDEIISDNACYEIARSLANTFKIIKK